MNDLFHISGLKVAFGQRVVLDIDNLHIPNHATTAIIGPNGAGKSTLLKALIGQYPSRVLHCLNEDAAQVLKQGKIAWVGQHEVFATPLTLLEYVLLGRYPHLGWLSRPSARDITYAETLLAEFELAAFAGKRLQALSGGEKQRVSLIRNLQFLPKILLLDEITSALDEANKRNVNELIHHYVRDKNIAVLWVTHDKDEINHADNVITLQPHAGEMQEARNERA